MSDKEVNKILAGVYSGKIDINNVPDELSGFTYAELIAFAQEGFGELSIEGKVIRMAKYEKNLMNFSGAKSFQNIKDLNAAVFLEDGSKRPFKEFKIIGRSIYDEYNINWLRAEQDASFSIAQGADKWIEIEEGQEEFPLLKYQTVADGRVREEHAAWDNIVRPVNDAFWNTHMPPNDFGCRCNVIQLHEGKVTSLRGRKGLKNESELFAMNPGKVDYIFNEKKHPYFKHTRAEGPAFKKSQRWGSKD